MKHTYKFVILALLSVASACERRPLSDSCSPQSLIPVRIDWAESGITPGARTDADYVHRVSIRFFPKDGSPVFDRYLEGNVVEGEISVPVGQYSVVVFNEALDDTYWSDAVYFTDVDSYDLFSANIVRIDPLMFEFYTPRPGQGFVGEPLKLASWSLDNFVVAAVMIPSSDPGAMINALTKVVLRRLFVNVKVVVDVVNLSSAMRMEGALDGLSSSVMMASGQPVDDPSVHLFAFPAPMWANDLKRDGVVERRYLAFGPLPQPATYSLELGMVFVSGERYYPDQPLLYNVTQQVANIAGEEVVVRVSLELPVVEGGVGVGGWDDEEIVIQ